MIITRSQKVRKALKQYHRAGRKNVLRAFEEVVDLLATYDSHARNVLFMRFKDHALTGDKKGVRELHLSHDDLLLYWVIMDKEIIVLESIVTHEELRKRR